MIIKFLGLSLITLSLTLLGNALSEEEKNKQALKEEFLRLLLEIERGIRYGGKPIETILECFTSPVLENSGLIGEMRNSKQYVYTIQNADILVDFSDKKLLCSFFENIGKSTNCEKELVICRECIERLQESIKKSHVECEKKAYIYRRMGLMSGILSVIILI